MTRTLGAEHVSVLARGFSWLGSGGGGSTRTTELILGQRAPWPVTVHDVGELDPSLPAVAVAYAGSTYLMTERLPEAALFEPLLRACERWTGKAPAVVCSGEGGGMNGLVPFLLAEQLAVVDADLTGRALPRIDQMSVLVDRVPGVIACASLGAGGVSVIEARRPADVEALVRASIVCAGGVGPLLMGGFTVGDLVEHSVLGGIGRALDLGAADPALPPADLAAATGARFLGGGRIESIEPGLGDPYASSALILADDGAVLRLVSHSEFLVLQRDGERIASAPDVIACRDAATGEMLEVQGLRVAQRVQLFALPAPEWWRQREHRLQRVLPSAYGITATGGEQA